MIFTLLPQAEDDLRNQLEYIAQDNPNAAHRVREAIIQTCELLTERPQFGHIVENISIPDIYRISVVGFHNYTIFYRIAEDEIEIIRLGWGGRDWENLL